MIGSQGRAELDDRELKTLRYTPNGEQTQILTFEHEGSGYQFEFMAAAECIRQGKLECEISPLDQSLDMARTSDEIRRQIGVRYPFDREEC